MTNEPGELEENAEKAWEDYREFNRRRRRFYVRLRLLVSAGVAAIPLATACLNFYLLHQTAGILLSLQALGLAAVNWWSYTRCVNLFPVDQKEFTRLAMTDSADQSAEAAMERIQMKANRHKLKPKLKPR